MKLTTFAVILTLAVASYSQGMQTHVKSFSSGYAEYGKLIATCSSIHYKPAACVVSNPNRGKITDLWVEEQISKSPCTAGESFVGIGTFNIFVSRGCRAKFGYRLEFGEPVAVY